VAPAGELNALSVLSSRKLLVTRAALDALKERAAAENKNGTSQAAAADEGE
jgi:hypothetical protein